MGWNLPGKGSAYHDCGEFWKKGCLNVEDHHQQGLLEDHVGKAFIKVIRRTCARAECPTCYESWAGKQAEKIEHRLKSKDKLGKVIHVVASVPLKFYNYDLADLRKKAYRLVKKVGLWGGSCIVHPFREICQICGSEKDFKTKRCLNCGSSQFVWYYSPHFHFLGYGWIDGKEVVKAFEETGWVVTNLGVRESVFATAMYQLSHSGVHKKKHSVTWFGSLSYNKFKSPPLPEKEKDVCPICERKLVRVMWIGEGECPVPDIEKGFYVDPGGWVERPSLFVLGKEYY